LSPEYKKIGIFYSYMVPEERANFEVEATTLPSELGLKYVKTECGLRAKDQDYWYIY
jgi:hypothetical protein